MKAESSGNRYANRKPKTPIFWSPEKNLMQEVLRRVIGYSGQQSVIGMQAKRQFSTFKIQNASFFGHWREEQQWESSNEILVERWAHLWWCQWPDLHRREPELFRQWNPNSFAQSSSWVVVRVLPGSELVGGCRLCLCRQHYHQSRRKLGHTTMHLGLRSSCTHDFFQEV